MVKCVVEVRLGSMHLTILVGLNYIRSMHLTI